MICVTIACGSHHRMIAEHQQLAADGVKLVELRLDFLRRDPDLKRLLLERPCATAVTVRRKQDGGLWNGTEAQRQVLLRSAIAEQPEFIDLEVDIARKIEPFGKTRRIISYHNPDYVPENLDELYEAMTAVQPYFVKIAAAPRNMDEMLRLLNFTKTKNAHRHHVIGICMGEIGKASRILAKRFGCPYTYATFSEERIIAPGILEYRELRDLYHYEQINAATKVFGVIGNPLGHSLSPLVHNRSYIEQNINAVYVPIQLTGSDVAVLLRNAEVLGLKGLSVTIPHKVTVLESLTRSEKSVQAIEACNTVLWGETKKAEQSGTKPDTPRLGYNTDYTAALVTIEAAFNGNYTDAESVLKNKKALILGAGGVSKAIAYGLQQRGAYVTITNRTPEKAVALSKQLGCEFISWTERNVFRCDILVNCTSVGMYPKIDETPVESFALHDDMLVFDAVYNPENTLLVKNARQQHCAVITGVDMFVGQACLQYKLFTGQKASPIFMRNLVREALLKNAGNH